MFEEGDLLMATAAPQAISAVDDSDREQAAYDAIKIFLSGSVALGGDDEIHRDLALLESGILDSLGILQLVTFLGDELNVEVSDEDFVAENFETIGSLSRFVARKQAANAS